MAWVAMAVATLVSLAALGGLLPAQRRPRWRLWLARRIDTVADRVRGPNEPKHDPFEALRLQTRLGVLAEYIRALEADEYVYAKAHRLLAAKAAYDDLLEEACRLAGIELEPGRRRSESRRYTEELELASRGWSW
jgi:hypothetical protein